MDSFYLYQKVQHFLILGRETPILFFETFELHWFPLYRVDHICSLLNEVKNEAGCLTAITGDNPNARL